jgi:pimeloyl-ACP methyl ester carboxylesterase
MGALPAFATLGLAFLFFIAGLEIDLPAIRGTPEFIKREHAEYLARYIPGARFELLAGVSHFAPLQRSAQFNASIVSFLDALPR